jgi:hypothetical protein
LNNTVDFSRVEEVDALFPGCPDTVDGELLCLFGVGVHPVAVGYHGDSDAGGPEESVLHQLIRYVDRLIAFRIYNLIGHLQFYQAYI